MRRCYRNQYEAKNLFLKARANFIRMVQDDVCRIEEVPSGHRLGPQCCCQMCCLATPIRLAKDFNDLRVNDENYRRNIDVAIAYAQVAPEF